MSTATWGVTLRRATAHDRSLAWVLAFGALSAAVLAALLPRFAPFVPACPFHSLTGLPCPGCGGTRAALALVRGDVAAAFGWNPLAALALTAGVAACALAPAWVALRGPLPSLVPVLPARARIALMALIVLNWVYLVTQGV